MPVVIRGRDLVAFEVRAGIKLRVIAVVERSDRSSQLPSGATIVTVTSQYGQIIEHAIEPAAEPTIDCTRRLAMGIPYSIP
jgi:hypothetical protein